MSSRERAAARRAARDAAEKAKEAEERLAWLARLESRGVEPWPDVSEEEHAAALAKSREMVDEVIALLPSTRLYETEHFLFTSNMPPQQVGPYVAYLDAMYAWMCELYGISTESQVWLGGKAAVFAFLTHQQFADFEVKYFNAPPNAGTQGLCHQNSLGHVVISCYCGNDPYHFGQMLVHETSHGFIHRYKTKVVLPNWVNEGMADVIGQIMVPRSVSVKVRESAALRRIRHQRTLGSMLTSTQFEPWQYGAASNLTRFLLEADREAYVRFIEGLKEGMQWDEAPAQAYHSTPELLIQHYGRWIGVPDLRP